MITEEFKFGTPQEVLVSMEHQAKAYANTRELSEYALFWEMGCAKSKVAIDTMSWLFHKGEIDGVIIIADKGAYRNWTDYELPIHMPKNTPWRSAVWKSTTGIHAKQKVDALLTAKDDMLDVVVMNVEAFGRGKADEYAKLFLQNHYAMVIVDESDSIKSPDSKRAQAVVELRDLCQYRRILTGTPIANNPLDLWMQAEFLKQGLLGESFVKFRAKYAKLQVVHMPRRKPFYNITGYQELDDLSAKLKPWSSRLLKTDCLDLPEKIYEVRYVEHTPEQERMYRELKTMALTEFNDGRLTAINALTALTKLHQINCGHVKMDNLEEPEEDGRVIDIPSNRITELLETLRFARGKAIIWAVFRRDFELIRQAIEEVYGVGSYVDYYGGTPENQRPKNIAEFLNNPQCRFFGSNPATGGRALTLTVADFAVYYSYNYRLALRLQSEDRNHRKGQKSPCTYVDLCVRNTIDVKVRRALRNKKDISSTVLGDFRGLLAEEGEEAPEFVMSPEGLILPV